MACCQVVHDLALTPMPLIPHDWTTALLKLSLHMSPQRNAVQDARAGSLPQRFDILTSDHRSGLALVKQLCCPCSSPTKSTTALLRQHVHTQTQSAKTRRHMHACMHACIYVHTSYTYIYIYIYMCIHIYIHCCRCLSISLYRCTYLCVCVSVLISLRSSDRACR